MGSARNQNRNIVPMLVFDYNLQQNDGQINTKAVEEQYVPNILQQQLLKKYLSLLNA